MKSKLSIRSSIRIRRFDSLRTRRPGSAPGSSGPGQPSGAQALKLTAAAAPIDFGLPMRRSFRTPSIPTPNTRGFTPGWSAVPRWGTPMNDRRHCPGLAGYSNGIIYGLIPGRYGNPKWMIDVLIPGWWGSRSRNCPNGATHTSPGQLPGIHIADHKKLLAWIIIRPIGGVAPTAQEFPVPLSIQPEA